MFDRFARQGPAAPLVFLHEFHTPPYGGGNQFLLALRDECVRQGVPVDVGSVGPDTRVVLFNSHHSDPAILRKIRRSQVRMVHRVDGPIGAYRGGDDERDQKVWQLNHEFADTTIFQSQYSLERHVAMGLAFREPHVIPNAADPSIFFPGPPHEASRPLRVIASSWSDNPRKGGPTYAWLDAQLDHAKVEFTFVGRIAHALPHSRVVDALPSEALAGLLRQHDVYLTASADDPCSNALIEALTCGLPAIFRRSGGHPELVNDGGLGFDRDEEIPGLLEELHARYAEFRARMHRPRLADVAAQYLRVMGLEPAGS